MKRSYLLYLIIPLSFGCSSTYKTLQTPDDVYYSPGFYINHSSNDSKKDSSFQGSSQQVYNTTYHREYDDAYYYNRRRRYYDNDDYVVYKTKPNKVSAPRTTNLNAWKPNKNNVPVNPKISGVPATTPPTNTSTSGHAIRSFKRPGNTVIGNVVRAIIGGDGNVSSTPNRTSNNASVNRNAPNSSSSSKSSSSAPVRSFEKKNN